MIAALVLVKVNFGIKLRLQFCKMARFLAIFSLGGKTPGSIAHAVACAYSMRSLYMRIYARQPVLINLYTICFTLVFLIASALLYSM